MINSIKRFKEFDEITEFRLWNAFLQAFAGALLAPIIVSLKGLYMAAWVISIFIIVGTLAVKANDYIVNRFSVSTMYKATVFIHIAFTVVSAVYFINPEIMIWGDSILYVSEIAIFSSYSIALTNYLTDHHPKDMKAFQIVRNSSWADGALLGGFLITGLTAVALGLGVIALVVYNLAYSVWLLKNYNFYQKFEQTR